MRTYSIHMNVHSIEFSIRPLQYRNSLQHLKFMDKNKSFMPEKSKPINKKFKHQYTKPYKDRDRTKDIGKGLPFKKSNRLHFPQSPQYYIIPTAKKLTKDNPFFNMLNKDQDAIHQKIKTQKEAKRIEDQNIKKESQKHNDTVLEQSKQNSSLSLRKYQDHECNSEDRNVYDASNRATHENKANWKQKLLMNKSSDRSGDGYSSSLGIVTISQGGRASPFNKGYSVTSGPKNYNSIRQHPLDVNSLNHSLGLSSHNSTLLSNKSDKKLSLIDLSQGRSVLSHSQRPSA